MPKLSNPRSKKDRAEDSIDELIRRYDSEEIDFAKYAEELRALFSTIAPKPHLVRFPSRHLGILRGLRLISVDEHWEALRQKAEHHVNRILDGIASCQSTRVRRELLMKIENLPVTDEEQVIKDIEEHLKFCSSCRDFVVTIKTDEVIKVKSVEFAGRELGEKYDLAFPKTAFGVISHKRLICYTSETFASLLGYTPEELVNNAAKIIHEDSMKDFHKSLDVVLDKREPYEYIIKYWTKSKKLVTANVRAVPVSVSPQEGGDSAAPASFGLVYNCLTSEE